MKKILSIAWFEFREKIRTRAFFIYMILFPAAIIASALLPSLLSDKPDQEPSVIGIHSKAPEYSKILSSELLNYKLEDGQPRFIPIILSDSNDEADKEVRAGILSGYLQLFPDSITGIDAIYRSRFRNPPEFESILNLALNRTAINIKLKNSGISDTKVFAGEAVIMQSVAIDKTNPETVYIIAVIYVLLLFMSIMFSGGMLVRSIIEEKSNRIIEILLSSISPGQLLTGKTIGLAFLGLVQIIVWTLLSSIFLQQQNMSSVFFENAGWSVLYFLLGYLFYTALFVGLGSTVNTEQEAQHLTGYLSIILALPLALAINILDTPNALWVKILSYFPLTSPSVMLIRIRTIELPMSEIIITLSIMIISIISILTISAKIFASNIIKYDKSSIIISLFKIFK